MITTETPFELQQTLVRTFLENVPDMVYFKDRESRIIAASASFSRHARIAKAGGIIGKTDFDLFDRAHAQPAFDDEQRILHTGEPLLGKLEKETWPDGRVTWVLTSKLPLRDPSGAIVGTFGLSKDVTRLKATEEALESARKELMDAARLAGMAEVATGVLHNVGNVLTSLNVSNNVIADGLRDLRPDSLARVVGMLDEHAADFGRFLTEDPKGKLIPSFLASFCRHLSGQQEKLLAEVASQQQNIDHIKDIVTTQQAYATTAGVVESLAPAMLMEDALRMNTAALQRHQVTLERRFSPVPLVLAERGKVLQILINLIRNGKYACDQATGPDKRLILSLECGPSGTVRFIVADTGVGIVPENLPRLFSHGFTTRPDGHGFGLHSSVLAAKEMHGTLTGSSPGPGRGATFILELPAAPAAAEPQGAHLAVSAG